MGVCFYVVDRLNKRGFDLGKGYWNGSWDWKTNKKIGPDSPIPETEIPAKEAVVPFSVEDMIAWVYFAWSETYHVNDAGTEPTDEDDRAYAKELGIKLWAFCEVAKWNVELRSDTFEYADEEAFQKSDPANFDANRYGLYPLVQSRYSGESSYIELDPKQEDQTKFEKMALDKLSVTS